MTGVGRARQARPVDPSEARKGKLDVVQVGRGGEARKGKLDVGHMGGWGGSMQGQAGCGSDGQEGHMDGAYGMGDRL